MMHDAFQQDEKQWIGVFCGSRPGYRTEYATAANRMGKEIARMGYGLIYGGSQLGLMGEISAAVHFSGGAVQGYLPEAMGRDKGLGNIEFVENLHQRQSITMALSDGCIALPGGFGTLAEITELITWFCLDLHRKPIGLLNTDGYYNGFVSFVMHQIAEGFVDHQNRDLLVVDDDPLLLLDRVMAHEPPRNFDRSKNYDWGESERIE